MAAPVRRSAIGEMQFGVVCFYLVPVGTHLGDLRTKAMALQVSMTREEAQYLIGRIDFKNMNEALEQGRGPSEVPMGALFVKSQHRNEATRSAAMETPETRGLHGLQTLQQEMDASRWTNMSGISPHRASTNNEQTVIFTERETTFQTRPRN